MATLRTLLAMTANIGGESVRTEVAGREYTLPNGTCYSQVISLADAGTPAGQEKTLWTRASGGNNMTQPAALVIIVDPDNVYADDLDTGTAAGDAPKITVQITQADTDGNNTASIFVDVSRERPLVIPNYLFRSAIDAATANRVLYTVTGRNNQADGFGTIKVRVVTWG